MSASLHADSDKVKVSDDMHSDSLFALLRAGTVHSAAQVRMRVIHQCVYTYLSDK